MTSSPPRVLLVSQPTVEGVAVCVAQLAAEAVRRGFEVSVACPEEGVLAPRAAAGGARIVPLELDRNPGVNDLRALGRIRALSRQHDLVHLHSSKAGAVGRIALRTMRGAVPPSVFSPHGWSWQAESRLSPAYRVLERLLADSTDAIIAVSPGEMEAGRAVLGSRGHVEVIDNGVDCSWFSPDGPTAPRTPDPLLVCLGRLSPLKGQDDAIRALASMDDSSVRLRLVGDGPQRDALVGLAAELGVPDRVEFIGNVEDPRAHLRAADVLVIASRTEGMSLAMLEAMACATPVVSTAVSGSHAIGDAGVVVPIDDPAALASALTRLIHGPDLADMSARARRRAVESFSFDQTVSATIDLWLRLLGRLPASDRTVA